MGAQQKNNLQRLELLHSYAPKNIPQHKERTVKIIVKLTAIAALSLVTGSALANPDVISREYKLMLKTNQFTYQSEATDVANLISDSVTAIEAAINRNVTGTPSLAHVRDVTFYDTASTCVLTNLGYSFRERVENGNSEVTLKFRGPDRYISDFEDVSSSTSGAATKLESDVGANSTTDFKIIYSHSTTVPNTRTINNMLDINHYFAGFETDYALSNTLSLSPVSYLTIKERVYKNVIIDLGSIDAEISVTLWYLGTPSGAQSPVVGEISFKYQDNSANYTRKVVNRAKDSFSALQGMSSWIDPNSITKTAFVYAYDANFCQ